MSFLGLKTKREVSAEIEAALKQAGKEEYSAWLKQTADASKYEIPDPSIVENQTNLYRNLSWIRTAVDIASTAAAVTPFSVYRKRGEKKTDIQNHDFEMLLDNPNPLDSRDALLTAIFASYKITGNGYWWLNKEAEFDRPMEIWFIPAHMIQPIPDENLYLKGYAYYPGDGSTVPMETWEIVHLRTYNPFNRFVGLSAIESIIYQSTGDLGAQKYNNELFGNNALIPSILAFRDQINNTDWERLKQEARTAGEKRNMLMLRGAGTGVNWMQAAISQRDMEYIAGRTFTKEEIWALLTPGLSSMLAVNATEANAIAGASTFNALTVYPMQRALSAKITISILPSYGLKLVGEFDDVRWKDRRQEMEEIKLYSQFHTIEEVRVNKFNDEPLGDERDGEIIGLQKPAEPEPEPPLPVTLPDNNEMPDGEQDMEENAEMGRMMRKAQKALKAGKLSGLGFESLHIPPQKSAALVQRLRACKTDAEIRAVCSPQKTKRVATDPLLVLSASIDAAVKALAETP